MCIRDRDHAGQGFVDGRVTVGVVRPHHVADDLGALRMRSVGKQPLVVHRVEDAAVDRLQAVAHIGQGTRHDDRHGVLEEGALHLLLDLDGLDEPGGDVLGGIGPAPALVVTSRHALSPSASSSVLLLSVLRSSAGADRLGDAPQMSRKRTSLALVWMKFRRRSTSSPMSTEHTSSAMAACSTATWSRAVSYTHLRAHETVLD